VPEELFTNRDEEFRWLEQWLTWASEFKTLASVALIGPRRMGKTAILGRLYDKLFWEQDKIAPFMFSVDERGETLEQLASRYYFEFIRQYVAFKTKALELMEDDVDSKDIVATALAHQLDWVEDKMPRMSLRESESPSRFWRRAMSIPRDTAIKYGTQVVVMIDEFQWLNDRVYEDAERRYLAGKLTSSFQNYADFWAAPMIVAGSAVTIMSSHVLSGALIGRFQTTKIGPMSIDDGVELAVKASRFYNIQTTLECARLISKITDGHPYYITQAFRSRMPDKDLTTPEGVEKVYEYELTQGEIREFWLEHFNQNMEKINADRTSKRIIFYLLNWAETTDREEQESLGGLLPRKIAQDLGLEEEETTARLKLLKEADVLERGKAINLYRGLRDDMLARCLRMEYEHEILDVTRERIEKNVIEKLRAKVRELSSERDLHEGRLRNLIGQAAQAMVQQVMQRGFNNQKVDGKYFGAEEQVFLPEMSRVYPTLVQVEGSEGHQIDNYGIPKDESHPHWITEQKNWAKPVPKGEVERFLEAADEIKEQQNLADTVLWFYAKSSFTEDAVKLAKEHGVLLSDWDTLSELMMKIGVA